MSSPYSSPSSALRALKPRSRVLSPRHRSAAVAVEGVPGVDLAAVGAAPDVPGVGRHGHVDRVARHLEHRDLLGHRVDRGDDQRVGVEEGVALALVDPDEQDVQPPLAVPRRAASGSRVPWALPTGVCEGCVRLRGRVGRPGALAAGDRVAGIRRVGRLLALRVLAVAEHAADEGRREHVVAGDGDVGAADDDQDGEEAGDRQRAQRELRAPEPATARGVDLVQEPRDVPRVDRRHDPVDQDQDVDDEDAGQHLRLDDEPEQVEPVDPQEDPAGERDQQQRQRGERQRARPGAGIGVTEPGEDQGQERRGERGSRARRVRSRRLLR